MFGQATKYANYLLSMDKSYTAKAMLGLATDSYDLDGRVTSRTRDISYSPAELKDIVSSLQGTNKQYPPKYSAIKINGKPAYKYAREDQDIEIPSRIVEIYNIKLLDYSKNSFTIAVDCSKGTYIRSIINDISIRLKIPLVVVRLHRVSIGNFKDVVGFRETLEKFSNKDFSDLISIDQILSSIPRLSIDHSSSEKLLCGQTTNIDSKDLNEVRIFSPNGFIGIGNVINGILKPVRMQENIV
jgi:tRNA pseudouridine55 synthase